MNAAAVGENGNQLYVSNSIYIFRCYTCIVGVFNFCAAG